MFDIIDNKIYLSRGDSATISVDIVDDEGEPYTPQSGESVVFTLKRTPSQCKQLIVKEFENVNSELVVTLTQDDTSVLAFGVYYYDVALVDDEGNVFTIIQPTEFELMEVIHNEFTSDNS